MSESESEKSSLDSNQLMTLVHKYSILSYLSNHFTKPRIRLLIMLRRRMEGVIPAAFSEDEPPRLSKGGGFSQWPKGELYERGACHVLLVVR